MCQFWMRLILLPLFMWMRIWNWLVSCEKNCYVQCSSRLVGTVVLAWFIRRQLVLHIMCVWTTIFSVMIVVLYEKVCFLLYCLSHYCKRLQQAIVVFGFIAIIHVCGTPFSHFGLETLYFAVESLYFLWLLKCRIDYILVTYKRFLFGAL